MNILHVRIIELTRSLFVHCGLWSSLPILACFAIAVIPVIRQSYAPREIIFCFSTRLFGSLTGFHGRQLSLAPAFTCASLHAHE